MVFESVVVEQGNGEAKDDHKSLAEASNVAQPVEQGISVSVDHMHVHVELVGDHHVDIVKKLVGPVLVVVDPKDGALLLCQWPKL